MFANTDLHTSSSKAASGNANNSLISVMYNRRTPMSPHQSKPAAPQRDTSSPTCVSSHNIPIERTSARRASLESTEHLGEFYDQATWRMYERIQSARRELQYSSSGQSVEMPSLDDRFKSRAGMTRLLHQRRRDSLGQQQQQEDQETDYFDDAMFDMDM